MRRPSHFDDGTCETNCSVKAMVVNVATVLAFLKEYSPDDEKSY